MTNDSIFRRPILAVLIGMSISGHASSQILVPLTITSGASTLRDTFGIFSASSYCIDGCFGSLPCEEELPPIPPMIFDARFVDSRQWGACLGVGVRSNLQDGIVGLPDTFWLRIQQPDTSGYPITITWRILDSDGGVSFTSALLSDTGGALPQVDMLSDTTTTITDRSIMVLQFVTVTDIDGAVDGSMTIPSGFTLYQNYPNPFNPTTTISYNLSRSEVIKLSVHDYLGRQVALLEEGHRSPGVHEVTFEPLGYPGGMYIARLLTGLRTHSIKLLYLR